MKNLKEVATEVAKREGKKVQARIGEIREILGILSDIVAADEDDAIWLLMVNNGKRRAKRKSKKQ